MIIEYSALNIDEKEKKTKPFGHDIVLIDKD